MGIQYKIIYFPYLGFKKDSIAFGGLTLWNFDKEKEARIPQKDIRLYIDTLLKTNVHRGCSIENIAVVSNSNRLFQPTKKDLTEVSELRLVLFLCGVAKHNIYFGDNVGFRMFTAENFMVVYQNFSPDSQWTAYSLGSIVKVTDGGYKIGEIKYERPPYVLTPNYDMDDDLFQSIISLRKRKTKAYRRILLATEAFINSYYNSPDLSSTARILEQTRAFEILLDFPEVDQRKFFKSKISVYCPVDKLKKQKNYSFLSERRKGIKEKEKGTMQVIWADRFYILRNHIIHGDKIKNAELVFKKQLHQDIALLFFLLSAKMVINEVLNKTIFYDRVLWKNGIFQYKDGSLYKIARKLYKNLKRL